MPLSNSGPQEGNLLHDELVINRAMTAFFDTGDAGHPVMLSADGKGFLSDAEQAYGLLSSGPRHSVHSAGRW